LLQQAGKGANICIVSSVTGKNPNWTIGVYGSTKAALDNMVIWMATELMADGIRVTGIAPGLIKTDFSAPLWKNESPAPEEAKGMPEEIGSVVATICCKDGSFMNGEVY
jgi:dehydrogenase/reductase SDR family member 4